MDIINIIATVNYINMGKNLIEHLGSKVPGIGRFIDDIAQGIGAGFLPKNLDLGMVDQVEQVSNEEAFEWDLNAVVFNRVDTSWAVGFFGIVPVATAAFAQAPEFIVNFTTVTTDELLQFG